MKSEKLNKLADELNALRIHKTRIKQVPDPDIICYFKTIHENDSLRNRLTSYKEQIAAVKKSIVLKDKEIERQHKIYQQRLDIVKDKIYILKVFIGNLESQYEQVKKNFIEVDFLKTLIAAIRRSYLYKLAQIFLNDQARNVFKGTYVLNFKFSNQLRFPYSEVFQSQSQQEVSTSLAYSVFLVNFISRILNLNLLYQYSFKGSRSSIKSVQKLEYPLYLTKQTDKKWLQQGLRLAHSNLCQILDAINIDKKYKKEHDLKVLLDIISQYIIVSEVDLVQLPH